MSLGQPVIIENMGGGATGSTGVGRVAHASPDGYTLSFGIWSTHVVNGAVYSLPYDVVKDFAADFTCCHSPTGNCLEQCGAGDEFAASWLHGSRPIRTERRLLRRGPVARSTLREF